jgi:biotin transport system substrate-specific component
MFQAIKRWDKLWSNYFVWISATGILEKILLSLCFAFFTGISAQIIIRLPFTPVPVTLQVLVVLLSGILLGRFGGLSQIFYLTGGIMKIPWFSGASFFTAGATTGYLIGFIPAAFFVGYFIERVEKLTSFKIFLILVSGLFIIYFSGVTWLRFFFHFGLMRAFLIGVLPFIGFDMVKVIFVTMIARAILDYRFIRGDCNGKKV